MGKKGITKFTDEVVDCELKQKQPTIIRIGHFTTALEKMNFQCLKCNYIFPNYLATVLYRGGCAQCSQKLKITNSMIDQKLINESRTIIRIGDITNTNSKSHIDWQCLICNYVWPTSYSSIFGKGSGCIKCSDCLRITNEMVDENINTRSIIRLEPVIDGAIPIGFLCQICDYTWKIGPGVILGRSSGCKKCAGLLKLTNADVDIRLSESFVRRISDYKGANIDMDVECTSCNYKWSKPAYNILRSKSCPICNRSVGEKAVILILQNNNIEFKFQYQINANDRRYFIDFYLIDYNLFIEYNGRQHYQDMSYKNFDFQKQIKRDNEIKEYAEINNINFYAIDGRNYEKVSYKENKSEFIFLLQNEIINYLLTLDKI